MTVGTLLVLALTLRGNVQPVWCATRAGARLVELAHSKFSRVTRAELALLKFVESNPAEAGGFAFAGPNANPDNPSNDPAHADEWSKDREVRAAVLRFAVCRSRSEPSHRSTGPETVGSEDRRNTEPIDGDGAVPDCPSQLLDSGLDRAEGDKDRIPGSIRQLYGPIHGNLINVTDYLGLRNGFHASGQVSMSDAKIGSLGATAGHFRYSPEPGDNLAAAKVALNLTGAQIRGLAFMDRGFESQGAVWLGHATIGGDLFCVSGRFINPGNIALFANGAEIRGSVYLGSGKQFGLVGSNALFEAEGPLSFELSE